MVDSSPKCDCADCNLPASTPQATGEKNTPNRPEIRVNIKEVVSQDPVGCLDLESMHLSIPNKTSGQTLTCPLKESLKDGQQPICGDKCLEPNPNLKLITEIEGLMSQVDEKLGEIIITDEISGDSARKWRLIRTIGEIDLFQNTTLRELKKAFE